MALKLLSLNIERDKHLPLIISLIEKEKPEVICLQEIQEPDFEMLKKKFAFQGFFAPMMTHKRMNKSQEILIGQGNAIFTRLNLLKTESFYYFGKGNSPTYTTHNSIDRVLVVGLVEKNGKKYKVTTTHFTRADDGGVNDEQRRDLKQLLELVKQQGELILCGDFNSPRGREIFGTISMYLKDNIPAHIRTTLDPQLHKAGPLPYVVDYLWSTPKYSVQKVRIIDGVSDHMAIVAEIEHQ